MSQDLTNKMMFLDLDERARLAAMLSKSEPVNEINRGRWFQLCDGSSKYVSRRELASLMMAIIRGEIVLSD